MFETKSGHYTDLVMRLDAGAGSNPDFVLAMKYLIDREQMRNAILRGYAVVANDQPIDPTQPLLTSPGCRNGPSIWTRPSSISRKRASAAPRADRSLAGGRELRGHGAADAASRRRRSASTSM